jgi:hypothetical protein
LSLLVGPGISLFAAACCSIDGSIVRPSWCI